MTARLALAIGITVLWVMLAFAALAAIGGFRLSTLTPFKVTRYGRAFGWGNPSAAVRARPCILTLPWSLVRTIQSGGKLVEFAPPSFIPIAGAPSTRVGERLSATPPSQGCSPPFSDTTAASSLRLCGPGRSAFVAAPLPAPSSFSRSISPAGKQSLMCRISSSPFVIRGRMSKTLTRGGLKHVHENQG